MPTNANTFNSRVTSEALEAKFRQVFPSQGGAELPQDLFASGVLQPVIDFSSVAEGSVLATNLQTAYGFATDEQVVENTSANIITTPGFWLVSLQLGGESEAGNQSARLSISDGLTSKNLWRFTSANVGGTTSESDVLSVERTIYVRSGDTVSIATTSTLLILTANYRQIADINGNLVNPLGFAFS